MICGSDVNAILATGAGLFLTFVLGVMNSPKALEWFAHLCCARRAGLLAAEKAKVEYYSSLPKKSADEPRQSSPLDESNGRRPFPSRAAAIFGGFAVRNFEVLKIEKRSNLRRLLDGDPAAYRVSQSSLFDDPAASVNRGRRAFFKELVCWVAVVIVMVVPWAAIACIVQVLAHARLEQK